MPLLYLLERLRNACPPLAAVFGAVTYLGDEIAFLAIALLVLWCVSKRGGYFLLAVGFTGTVINQFLKITFRIPRPWVLDPDFEIWEGAREAASGYSFPSGHTQNVVGTLGGMARWTRRLWLRITLIVLAVLVAFSRMYLGVHYPTDVLFSVIFGTLLVMCLYPIFESEERFHKCMPYVVAASVLLALGNFLLAVLTPEADVDAANLASALKNGATLLGCTAGLIPVYLLDRYVIKFDTGARWYAQVIKLVIGLGVVLLIKEGLSSPLAKLFGNEYLARAVRYFLIVMFAGSVWPLTFAWFGRMRIGFMERFTAYIAGLFKSKKAE